MLAIRAARLFDGENAVLVARPTVIVSGGRIADIRTDGDVPRGCDLVDLGDATLLPGLIDAHMHLGFDASADPVGRLATASDDEVLDGMRAAARTALAAGITTVRDLGDRGYLSLRLRDELAGDPTGGPQVLAAGPPITTTRGHCWFLGGEADGVDGVRAAVRARAEHGVDVIKLMASGGDLTPGTYPYQPQYGPEELRAAVQEAHRLGLPITAHAHASIAIWNAVNAGFDSIEHGSFVSENGIDARQEIVDALVRSGTMVSATLGMVPGSTLPPHIAAQVPAFIELFAHLTQAGVIMVCSTDAGIGPSRPHNVLPHAVAMLVETHGWSAADALRAATSLAARLCRIDDRKGRLATGFDADILAVADNPLTNPSALLKVRAVFRLGCRVH